jgi:hypothetical protein
MREGCLHECPLSDSGRKLARNGDHSGGRDVEGYLGVKVSCSERKGYFSSPSLELRACHEEAAELSRSFSVVQK